MEKPSYKGENPFKEAVRQVIEIEQEDYIMEKNEIKKALYKQKPMAERGNKKDNITVYSTEVVIDGNDEEIIFQIPNSEMVDIDGNDIFSDKEPAQLLIRWLVV